MRTIFDVMNDVETEEIISDDVLSDSGIWDKWKHKIDSKAILIMADKDYKYYLKIRSSIYTNTLYRCKKKD